MLSDMPPVNSLAITDVNRLQSAKRLDQQDPVLADRFTALVSGSQDALKSGQSVLTAAKVKPDTSSPRSLKDDVFSDISILEQTVGTMFKMNNMNGEKHQYLDKKGEVSELAEVLYGYNDFGMKYFIVTSYAQNTGVSTMEEINIFTKGS